MQNSNAKHASAWVVYPILVLLAYYFAGRWGLSLASLHGNVSPVWPAAGVAVAALIFGGLRFWPAVFLGAFVVNVFTAVSLWTAAMIAAGNTLEAVLGAIIYRQMQSRTPWSGKFAEGAGILLMSAAAPVAAAAVGVGALSVWGTVSGDRVGELLLTWWSGDAIGILVFAPALLALRRPRCRFQCLLRLVAFLMLLTVVCYWIASAGFEGAQIFLMFPLLLVAAWWFDGGGVKLTAALLVAFTVTVMVVEPRHLVAQSLNQSLLLLELFLVSLACTGLLLAAFRQAGLLLLPGMVMVLGWLISGLLFVSLERQRVRLDVFRFDTLVHDSEALIRGRLETYVDALRGGASFYAAAGRVSREQWRKYAAELDITRRHPGINGIGVVTPVRYPDVDDFLTAVRADGAPSFEITPVPKGSRPEVGLDGYRHYVITYIEPLEPNLKALGLDLASESNRAEAARAARDSGRATITDRITLVQDGRHRPGFLVYYPMYEPGAALDTTAHRQAAFRGWIYAPFITENFLSSVLGQRADQISMQVYAGDAVDAQEQLFVSGRAGNVAGDDVRFVRQTRLRLLDKTFTIVWRRGLDFRPGETVPAMVAGSSLALVSALLAGLVLTLQTLSRRAAEIAESRTHELRELNAKLEGEVAERSRAEREARVAREAAEAANSAKSAFLATMSHEIRTPMNSVIGYTDLLLDSPVNDEQRIWLSYIQASGRALLSLINDILDFSKIEAGKLELEAIPFAPLQTTREVVMLLGQKAAEQHLDLSIDVQNRLPDAVLGDPARFRQVLTNLVANAIKFTEHGSVRVRLDWHAGRPAGHGRLEVSVEDTGIGIPADKLGSLFSKFTQADSSTTRRYGGTGLGLAICKQLVELMGGSIVASSVPGMGTSIRFKVPFSVTAMETRERMADPVKGPAPLPWDPRVLMAEDAVMNQRLAVAVLRRLGCSVDLASNGREAVEKFGQCRYDIIYMDCQMPVMDGFDAAREIRRLETKAGRLHRTPIIAVTANALTGDRDRCLEAGMDDYISKPFTIADFARTLNEWVERAGR